MRLVRPRPHRSARGVFPDGKIRHARPRRLAWSKPIHASGWSRSEALERQADATAERFLKGDRNVGQSLFQVSAASIQLSGSAGRPLPTGLRKELEAGFGADLATVRIHTDPEAAAASFEAGARAFTGGSDIYFGDGHYRPDTPWGRRLLLHEVAHVLQQTGRPGADGRLRATAAHGGMGELQRAPDLADTLEQGLLFRKTPADFAEISGRFTAQFPNDQALTDELRQIEGLLGGELNPRHPNVEAVVALSARLGLTPAVRGLYADVLKALGRYKEAGRLLLTERTLPTSYMLGPFFRALRQSTADWLSATIAADPRLRKLFPRAFIETYRIFLFGPGRVVQNLDIQQGKFGEKFVLEAFDRARAQRGLIDNEADLAALVVLFNLDQARFDLPLRPVGSESASSPDVLKPAPMSKPQYKRQCAQMLLQAKSAAEYWAPGRLTGEALALWEQVFPELQDIARQVIALWEREGELESAQSYGGNVAGLGAATEIIAAIGKDRRFAGLERFLTSLAAQATAGDPSPSGYADILSGLRGRLRDHALQYEVSLINMSRNPKTHDDRYAVQLAWVLKKLFWIDSWLEQYSRRGDEAYVQEFRRAASKNGPAAYAAADVRLFHRIGLSRMLRVLVDPLGYAQLSAVVQRYLARAGQNTPVALIGEFVTSEAALGDAARELSTALPIRKLEPLTVGMLLDFLFSSYYENLTQEIDRLLAAQGQDLSGKKGPILGQAVQAMQGFARPRRYVMPLSSVVMTGRERIADLLFAHPKVDALIQSLPKNSLAVIPEAEGAHANGIVVWEFPNLDKLIDRLRNIEPLNEAVNRQWEREHNQQLAADEQLGWWTWLQTLVTVAKADATAATTVRDELQGDLKAQQRLLDRSARRATSHQRRVVRAAIQRLDQYREGGLGKRLQAWSIPIEVLQDMLSFGGSVYPRSDQPLQLAALLLEEAVLLERNFGSKPGLLGQATENRYDIVSMLWPLVVSALDAWDHPTRDDLLRKQILDPALSESQLTRNVGLLRKLSRELAETAIAAQRQAGVEGNSSAGTLSATDHAKVFKPGQSFQIEGIRYELVSVAVNFVFHPAYLGKTPSFQSPTAPQVGRSILKVDGKELAPADRKSSEILCTIKRDGRLTALSQTDDALLSELSYALAMRAIVEELLALKEAMETGAEIGLEIVETLQPEIAVAHLFVTAVQFLASEEFQDIKAAITTDGAQLVSKAWKRIKEEVTPGRILSWFFLGPPLTFADRLHEPAPTTDAQQRSEQYEARSSGGTLKRLAEIIKRLARLAEHVGIAVDKVREVARAPVRQLQLYLLEHPVARFVVHWVIELFDMLASMNLAELLEDPKGTLKRAVADGVQEVVDRAREGLQMLATLELPKEIIPMVAVVDLVIDLVINRLGPKWKAGAKGLRLGLQMLHLWPILEQKIADELVASGVDVNKLWQQLVRDELEKPWEKMRDEFMGEIVGMLRPVPWLSAVTDKPGTPFTFTLLGEEFIPSAEAQPHLAAHPAPLPPDGPPGSLGPGQPLAAGLRVNAEQRFGHDFAHVRLHHDSEGARFTGSLGADALASGSHVFLRPDLPLASDEGRRVLDHELAHVLQQAGPRPLGGSYDATPRSGAPGVGLRYDPARESEAERVAAAATGVAASPRQLSAAIGLQPSFKPLVREFLAGVNNEDKLLARVAKIDEAARTMKVESIEDEEPRALAQALVEPLKKKLEEMKSDAKKFKAPFDDPAAMNLIVSYIQNNKLKEIAAAIPELVVRSSSVYTPPKPKEGPAPKSRRRVYPDRLRLNLEEYLFGKTGADLDVTITTKTIVDPDTEKKREVVDPDSPLKDLVLRTLYLPYIGGTADIWDVVITNTYQAKRSPTLITKFAPADIGHYKAKARTSISAPKTRATFWDAKQFKLADGIASDIEKAVHRPPELQPADLPPWRDYLETDATKAQSVVGLRVGRHGDVTQHAPDRESHHTTQYLLLQYLNNVHPSFKPFPVSPITTYPGIQGADGRVKLIVASTGTRLRIADYELGRGREMPTVLLSAETHQKGGIHLSAEKPDDEPAMGASQGSTADRIFRGAMADYAPLLRNKAKLQAIQAAGQAGVDGVTADLLKDRIFDAACKTYTQIRRDMMAQLAPALDNVEWKYYDGMAAAAPRTNPKEYEMPKDIAARVMPAIRQKNDDILEGEAGFEKRG